MNVQGSSRWCAVAVVWAALAGVSGCSGPRRPAPPPGGQPGVYLTPPTLVGAARSADGAVRLTGRAQAGAVVRLRAPDGTDATTRAGDDGRWTLDLPGSASPRLFAFQAELAGEVVRGEGALAVLPAPGPAGVVLRAGFASTPAERGQPGRLQLVSIDYDGGGAAAAGLAPPQTQVRMAIDGVAVGSTEADAQGRFGVLAVAAGRIGPGLHQVRVYTPQGYSIERAVRIDTPVLPSDRAFTAAEVPGGWTIAWRLPGGGAGASLVFDSAASAAPVKASGSGGHSS